MRSLLLAVVVAGCGGGASIPPTEPDVEIRSSLCNVESSAFLVVNVTYDVTLDVGQAFVASVDGGGSLANPNSSYSCFGWTSTTSGNQGLGCQRDGSDQPATTTVEHFFNATLPDVPVQFSVALLGSALDAPRSEIMLANASDTITCTLPP